MARIPPPPIGWPLLPVPDDTGRLEWPSLTSSIHDQIRVVLQTRPGEQLMRPRFGAGLQELVGQPDTLATRQRIQELVTSSLDRWERRISIEGVEVFDDPTQPGIVRVDIRFRIRRTGAASQLGVTLALEQG